MQKIRNGSRRSMLGRQSLSRVVLWSALVGLLSLMSHAGRAHNFTLTDAVLVIKANGQFVLDLTSDLDALALGVGAFVSNDSEATPDHDQDASITTLARRIREMESTQRERLEERLVRLYLTRVKLRVDGEVISHRVEFPDRWQPALTTTELSASDPSPSSVDADGLGSFFGTTARLSGEFAPGTSELSVAISRSFRSVHLTILQQRADRVERQVLGPGERSQDILLRHLEAGSPGASQGVSDSRLRPGGSAWEALLDYINLGFTHIIPAGLDHIAFVFGLCLLSLRWRSLALWVSAFTVGHTASLALVTTGALTLSPAVVEPLIALSIGWVGWRALLRSRRPRPLASEEAGAARRHDAAPEPWAEVGLVAVLGILHGSGFGGALAEIGLPSSHWLEALIGFNLGVEFGQLMVLFVGVALLRGLFQLLPARQVINGLASILILASVYWTGTRLGLF